MTQHDVFAPARLGPISLRNRTIKAATYENRARRGLVTDELIDFHVHHARGGVAMTTVAYCAVSREGRTDRHQIVWREEALPGLRRLTEAVHAEGAAISAQIGHSGPVGDRRQTGAPALAPSRRFSLQAFQLAKAASAEDLRRIVGDYRAAVTMAVDAGFDAVEVHLGHNYLISAFLSPKLNRRTDEYGGPLAGRARLALEVMQAVREAAGHQIAVLGKLNMDDGVPGGFSLEESVQVAQWLERDGTVDALELTVGSSLLNPMYLFRGDVPLKEFAAVFPAFMRPGVLLMGPRLLRAYEYQDAYLLDQARHVRAAVTLPLVLLGGISGRESMEAAMRSGFEFVAMGRALLADPDLVNRLAAGAAEQSLCTHCNKCMPTTFSTTHCVLDPQRLLPA